ncbi:MAG: protein-glutamate O-methyltransferase CheR [Acidimicrobiales bacterium]
MSGVVSPESFRLLQRTLADNGGMVLDESKAYLVSMRLGPVAKELGYDDEEALVRAVGIGQPGTKTRVVEAMTINETSWFRDPSLWEQIERSLIPQLLESARTLRRLDIWVAASSTGQEVYSVAMLLAEILGSDFDKWRIRLVASDLSSEMVERTQQGTFSGLEMSRGLSPARRKQFFDPVGSGYQIKSELRALVSARQNNLVDPSQVVRGPFDLILMRNVLIYFTPQARQEILGRQAELLRPHGKLILGASEGALGVPDSLRVSRFGRLVTYERSDEPEQPTRAAAPASTLASSTIPAATATAAARPGTTRLAAAPAPAERRPLSTLTPPATTPNEPSTPAKPKADEDDGLTPIERLRALRKSYNLDK